MGLVLPGPVEVGAAAGDRGIQPGGHRPARPSLGGQARARNSLATALDVGELLADSYVEQALALRHRQMARLPTFLGLRLDHRCCRPTALAHLLTAFNSVTVPLTVAQCRGHRGGLSSGMSTIGKSNGSSRTACTCVPARCCAWTMPACPTG